MAFTYHQNARDFQNCMFRSEPSTLWTLDLYYYHIISPLSCLKRLSNWYVQNWASNFPSKPVLATIFPILLGPLFGFINLEFTLDFSLFLTFHTWPVNNSQKIYLQIMYRILPLLTALFSVTTWSVPLSYLFFFY